MTGFILARFLQSVSFIQRRQMALFTSHKKPRSLVDSADLCYAYCHILQAHALKTPLQRANVIPRACVTLIQGNAYGQRTLTRNHKILFPGLHRNSLYRAARIANFEGILGFCVPSIVLVKAG